MSKPWDLLVKQLLECFEWDLFPRMALVKEEAADSTLLAEYHRKWPCFIALCVKLWRTKWKVQPRVKEWRTKCPSCSVWGRIIHKHRNRQHIFGSGSTTTWKLWCGQNCWPLSRTPLPSSTQIGWSHVSVPSWTKSSGKRIFIHLSLSFSQYLTLQCYIAQNCSKFALVLWWQFLADMGLADGCTR